MKLREIFLRDIFSSSNEQVGGRPTQTSDDDSWDEISDRAIDAATAEVSKGQILKVLTPRRLEAAKKSVKGYDFKAASKL